MRIAFLVATRGNPARAAAVIESAKALASGKHDIAYILGYDADDNATEDYEFSPDIIHSRAPRPPGVGAVWNRCAAVAMAHKNKPDVLVPFVDDGFVATPGWDEIIALSVAEFPMPELAVLAWNDLANPDQCSLPIITREWYDLAGLYDDRFPFWFYDSCVAETWSFVVGGQVPIMQQLVLAQMKGITRRMRDLAMWWDFYVQTRPERLKLAAEIRAKVNYKLTPEALAAVLRSWIKRDAEGRAGIEPTERNLAEKAPPTPEYVQAREAAQRYLADNSPQPLGDTVKAAPAQRQIFLACISYTGQVEVETKNSMIQGIAELNDLGIAAFDFSRVGDSAVSRGRNSLLTDFLAGGATDIIMVDADVSWQAGSLARLASHNVDLVLGCYPSRRDPVAYPVRYLVDDHGRHRLEADPATGLLEIEAGPGGFFRITRACVEAMIAAYGDLWYHDENCPGKKAWALFDFELDKDARLYFGEDMTFCRRYRAIGGKVWLDPSINFGHSGRKTWYGCIADAIQVERAKRLGPPLEALAILNRNKER